MPIDYVSVSNLIIDDISLPRGQKIYGNPGGAGYYALAGMKIWSNNLGLVANVGNDYMNFYRVGLDLMDVDLNGIQITTSRNTSRAWQIYDEARNRTEIFQEDLSDQPLLIDSIPDNYFHAKGYHLLLPNDFDFQFTLLTKIRKLNPQSKIVWEPTDHHPYNEDQFKQLLTMVDVFSPNIDELLKLSNHGHILTAGSELIGLGAKIVAARMGSEGSMIFTSDDRIWNIPAVVKELVDVTGAGNAYCGGFVTGLAENCPVEQSALRGAISSSYVIEQFGIPDFSTIKNIDVKKRFDIALDEISQIQ